MSSYGYDLIGVEVDGRIVTATVANGPMNLISSELLSEIDRFTSELEQDPQALVVVLKSSTPGFFICHAKFEDLGVLKTSAVPQSVDEAPMNPVQRICQRLRSMNKVSIAQVEGRATGGGATIAMSCDLRYASIGGAVFNSFGVPLGTGLGGGATQFMPRLVGRTRAMELILGALDLDAETADSWGYVTRALPAAEIDEFVAAMARRIAMSVPDVIRRTKQLIANSDRLPIEDGLRAENFSLQQMAGTPEGAAGIAAFLELGGETIEGEHRLADLLGEVLKHTSG
ncbi:enoyl-CoA hydratase/isomerase family protein [Rhodococcus sp. NPDC057529]|uniref:enoyl-CoA hydratase/isomerase family protein n=1 Tax=Rhodococcus sp. NPDC057529 TaxID=3346158 RepID=UPI00366E946B